MHGPRVLIQESTIKIFSLKSIEEEEEEEEEEILAVIYKNKMNKGYFVYKKENNDQNRE